ncbi:MAG: DUF3325 domain-containing protein [Pseudomonadota bacterium]
MMHLLILVLCLAGFFALAFAMDRQQGDLFGREFPPATTRWLRIAGSSVLLLALALLVNWQGWAMGLVMLSGHTSAAAGLVYVALITWLKRAARS